MHPNNIQPFYSYAPSAPCPYVNCLLPGQTHSTRVPPLTPQAALRLYRKSRNLLNDAKLCLKVCGRQGKIFLPKNVLSTGTVKQWRSN